jgi:murein DD-endopeptidase MepM/ murein hydrolase activator NlpD
VEASTRKRLRPAKRLARKVLLPPLIGGAAVLCLLLAVALSFNQRNKTSNPLAEQATPEQLAKQLTVHLEGTPTPADIRRAQKPLSERRRLLHAHPYFSLYKIAKRRFDVSWYLVAAVHYQDTGFGEARKSMAQTAAWRRHKRATDGILRPTHYPNRTIRHPNVKDDFDYVMSIAAGLKKAGARHSLMETAHRAVSTRYGNTGAGRLATAMVLERAKAWRLLGTIPLPGRGELATPVKGVVGGCGYFGCPRPGHLHNGVDFLARAGTPIHAVDAGVVASVESPGQSGGYGNFVCIQHRPHLASCYAHMSAFAAAVRPGARVKRGQVIGLVGSTGHSTAPHLHFELRRGPASCSACAIDPLPMLSGAVPDAALPNMTNAAPISVRATRAPAAIAAVPAPAATAPVNGESGGATPQTAATRGRERTPDVEPTTGGARPAPVAPQAPVAPAPPPPPTQTQQPAAPPAPPDDTGTGGVVVPPEAPAPPPAPAAPPG